MVEIKTPARDRGDARRPGRSSRRSWPPSRPRPRPGRGRPNWTRSPATCWPGRGHLAVPGLPARLRPGAVPGGHLHLGQRRRPARHPGPVPAGRRRPAQRGLRGRAGRLDRRRRGLLHHRAAAPGRHAADRRHQAALRAGIAAAVPGARIGDISAAIGAVGRAGRLRHLHRLRRSRRRPGHARGPARPQRGTGRPRPPLGPGLVIAIEPWFLAGGRDMYRIDGDGWTIRSGDGSRAAHVEHTVAVTEDGPQVLTVPCP